MPHIWQEEAVFEEVSKQFSIILTNSNFQISSVVLQQKLLDEINAQIFILYFHNYFVNLSCNPKTHPFTMKHFENKLFNQHAQALSANVQKVLLDYYMSAENSSTNNIISATVNKTEQISKNEMVALPLYSASKVIYTACNQSLSHVPINTFYSYKETCALM